MLTPKEYTGYALPDKIIPNVKKQDNTEKGNWGESP